MKIVKCPRCELNYILDGGELCTVCRKGTLRSEPDELDNLCMECGTNLALPGEDLCSVCLAAKRRREKEHTVDIPDDDSREDLESIRSEEEDMDGITIEVPDEDIPASELAQIEDDLDFDDDPIDEEDGSEEDRDTQADDEDWSL